MIVKIREIKKEMILRPNAMVTVIGRDMGAIAANEVESVIDYALPEAKTILRLAREQGKFVPLIVDDAKIKSLLVMTQGAIYPSTFRVTTLMERIKSATTPDGLKEAQQEYTEK